MALSDPGLSFASPLTTVRRTKFGRNAAALMGLAAEHGVGALVLGLPVNMDGTEGPRAQATRAFARNLRGLTELPIVLWDERWSTLAAERAMLEADALRARRAERIDAVATSLILQGALDRLRRLREG